MSASILNAGVLHSTCVLKLPEDADLLHRPACSRPPAVVWRTFSCRSANTRRNASENIHVSRRRRREMWWTHVTPADRQSHSDVISDVRAEHLHECDWMFPTVNDELQTKSSSSGRGRCRESILMKLVSAARWITMFKPAANEPVKLWALMQKQHEHDEGEARSCRQTSPWWCSRPFWTKVQNNVKIQRVQAN